MTIDDCIKKIDRHLRAFTGVVSAGAQPFPQKPLQTDSETLQADCEVSTEHSYAKVNQTSMGEGIEGKQTLWSAQEKKHAARLMRVNHVGEICAQALYQAQRQATHSEPLRALFEKASDEEEDHLNWTAERLTQLGTRPSLLNPFWYSGAFMIGLLAGVFGDRFSLGMMAETERQVEQHLAGHLKQWPAHDAISIAILERMIADEIAHGKTALHAGGIVLPRPVRFLMRIAARVMTSTAYYI